MNDYHRRLAHCEKRLATAQVRAHKPNANGFARDMVIIWSMKCDMYKELAEKQDEWKWTTLTDREGNRIHGGDKIKWLVGPMKGWIQTVDWYTTSYCGYGFNSERPLTEKKSKQLVVIHET